MAWAWFLVPCMVSLVVANASPASADSRVIWQRLFSRPGGGNAAFDVTTAPDGSAIYVTGTMSNAGNTAFGIETIAYDPADGATLWETRYFGGGGDDSPSAIAVSPDGDTVFVTGSTETDAHGLDWETIAYDASDGAQRWIATYGGVEPRGGDYPIALVVSPDGGTLFITGYSWQGAQPQGVPTTIAYDASNGATRWTVWDETAPYGSGQYVAVSPDGSRVDVTAGFSSKQGTLPTTRTYSYDAATGAQVWQATFRGGTLGSGPNGMELAPDGSHLYLTALLFSGNIGVLSYDASTGDRLWVVQTSGPVGLGTSPSDMAVTPDGSQILVSGSTRRFGKRVAIFLWSVDAATGAPRWRRWYQREGDAWDVATVVAVSPDGSAVYLSGIGCLSTYCDDFGRAWLTRAYSLPDGAPLWSSRISPPDTDHRVFSIAVTPDSTKVVVVGDRYSQTTGTDSFATIVYAA